MTSLAAAFTERRERPAAAPRWAAYPLLTGGLALLVAAAGLFWDVAYHIDHGRDANLFTPAHLMILAGLLGIALAAAGSVFFATLDGAATGWRAGPLRVPYAALPLGLMAAGALLGFPLDDLWHRTYGIDVTLWSPTHLLMIGAAVLSTLALNLFLPEAGVIQLDDAVVRWRRVSLGGSILLGLSVFQLEFDFGVPQWPALLHPLLVAATAAFGLVAARAALGRGGAIRAAAFYLGLRLLLTLFVRGLGHTTPAFPLFAAEAALVEVAFAWEARLGSPLAAGSAGLLAGTLGLAAEWAWTQAVFPMPWRLSLQPALLLPPVGAVAAALAGLAFGRVLAMRPSGLPAPAVAASLVVLAAALALLLPRTGANLSAAVSTAPAGPPRPVTDRFGRPATEQDYDVTVALDPAGGARGGDWFAVLAWQGGGRRVVPLHEVAPGLYRAAALIPTGGSWKAVILLARGSELVAAPLSFPPDPEYRQAGTAIQPQMSEPFVPASRLMMSEAHGGPPWVAGAASAALAATVLAWVGGLGLAARRISAPGAPPEPAASRRSAARTPGVRARPPA